MRMLEEKIHERARAKYSSVPDHALPKAKYNDSTANGLSKAMLDFLSINNHKAWRQSSEGRFRPGKQYTDVIGRLRIMKGEFLPGQNNGAGDVCAIVRGRFISWEIKIGKDRQSPIQKRYQKEVEQSGGLYFICGSFDEFLTQYTDDLPFL